MSRTSSGTGCADGDASITPEGKITGSAKNIDATNTLSRDTASAMTSKAAATNEGPPSETPAAMGIDAAAGNKR